MAIIKNVNMPDFELKEFNEMSKYMHVSLLSATQYYRTALACAVNISKAIGSIARMDGRKTSTHRIFFSADGQITKYSTGIDVFCNTHIFKAWTVALNSNLFGGVGVYFDTYGNDGEFWPMLHLDLRSLPLAWYRENGKYFYIHKDKNFFRDIQNLFMINRVA